MTNEGARRVQRTINKTLQDLNEAIVKNESRTSIVMMFVRRTEKLVERYKHFDSVNFTVDQEHWEKVKNYLITHKVVITVPCYKPLWDFFNNLRPIVAHKAPRYKRKFIQDHPLVRAMNRLKNKESTNESCECAQKCFEDFLKFRDHLRFKHPECLTHKKTSEASEQEIAINPQVSENEKKTESADIAGAELQSNSNPQLITKTKMTNEGARRVQRTINKTLQDLNKVIAENRSRSSIVLMFARRTRKLVERYKHFDSVNFTVDQEHWEKVKKYLITHKVLNDFPYYLPLWDFFNNLRPIVVHKAPRYKRKFIQDHPLVRAMNRLKNKESTNESCECAQKCFEDFLKFRDHLRLKHPECLTHKKTSEASEQEIAINPQVSENDKKTESADIAGAELQSNSNPETIIPVAEFQITPNPQLITPLTFDLDIFDIDYINDLWLENL